MNENYKRALFIASSKAGEELSHGEGDCRKINNVFRNRQFGGVEESFSPPMLLNCENKGRFLTALIEFFDLSKNADQRIIYFTGHGSVVGQEYGLVFDFEKPALPFSTITSLLGMHDGPKTLFILDTCYSGKATMKGIKNIANISIQSQGSGILASSDKIELSREDSEVGSIFTHYLCECITSGNGGQPTVSGKLSISDVSKYVNKLIREKHKGIQTPEYSIKSANDELWIANNISGTVHPGGEVRAVKDSHDKFATPCNGATIDDLDEKLLEMYARNYLEIEDVSKADYKKDLDLFVRADFEQPIYAAILCLGKKPSKFIPYSTSMFTMGDLASEDVLTRQVDGSLVEQFEQLLSLIKINLSYSNFSEGTKRVTKYEIPENVIREILANALAHRNYSKYGNVRVHISDEYLEISNPGTFPIEYNVEEFFTNPGISVSRNPRITNILRTSYVSEGIGRGFTVLSQYRDTNGPNAISITDEKGFIRCKVKRIKPGSDDIMTAKYHDYVEEKILTLSRVIEGNNRRYLEDVFVEPVITDEKNQRISLEELNFSKGAILLEGAAGSGKTTLSKYLWFQDAKIYLHNNQNSQGNIPFYFKLRDFSKDMSLLGSISNAVQIDRESLAMSFGTGKAIIYFDGFDELKHSSQIAFRDRLSMFLREHPKVRILITTRPRTTLEEIDVDFIKIYLNGFEENSVAEYIDETVASTEQKKQLIAHIKHFSTNQLISPLMLKTIIDSFRNNAHVPISDFELMENAFTTLYYRHDASKELFRRDSKADLSISETRFILGYVAFRMKAEQRFEFSLKELVDVFNRSKNTNTLPFVSFDSGNLIADLLDRGIIVKDGMRYSFIHRNLADHLLLTYLMNLNLEAREVSNIIFQFLAINREVKLSTELSLVWARTHAQCDRLIDILENEKGKESTLLKDDYSIISAALKRHKKSLPSEGDIDKLFSDDWLS